MAVETFLVGGSPDDAWEGGTGVLSYIYGYSFLWAYPNPAHSMYRCAGFRFPNVTIPQGSSISAATFQGHTCILDQDDINTKIYGNNVDNAEDFEVNAHIISTVNRPRTTAYVSWVQDALGVGWKSKTGLQGIVQEIVGRGGWISGNAIVLLFIVNTNIQKWCRIWCYDEDPGYAAKLQITWTPPPVEIIDRFQEEGADFKETKFGATWG